MSPSTRPGLVRGRPGPAAMASRSISGTKARECGAARRWSPGPAAGTPGQPAGESCWSARPGTGPTSPGPCNSVQPLMRTGALSTAAASRAGSTSAGGLAGPRPRADAPARPSHLPRPSTPARAPHRSRRAAGPGSCPTSHPRTSGGAGDRRLPVPNHPQSRHGHPARVRKKIPSITSRRSFHRAPPRVGRQQRFQPAH